MTDGVQHVPDDGIIDAATIREILEQSQFVAPTLNVFEYAYRDPVLQQYFDVQPGSNRTLDHAQTNAQLLYEAGVPLIAGTDSVGSLDMNVEVAVGQARYQQLSSPVHCDLGFGTTTYIDDVATVQANGLGDVEVPAIEYANVLNGSPHCLFWDRSPMIIDGSISLVGGVQGTSFSDTSQ
ncbi:putative Amidohydrolase-related domain-containing protein [Seiridium unicorne]|uniref:Amidohydrolase-related domain-containing protein n=1 Tax=Seiridium unicorne TaxID=138068 RepID=A0ABR2UJ80_9PEZI